MVNYVEVLQYNTSPLQRYVWSSLSESLDLVQEIGENLNFAFHLDWARDSLFSMVMIPSFK